MSVICLVPVRVSHWSPCANSCTFRLRPPTRPHRLICATSRCLIQPLLKVVSQKTGVTQGSARPSWRVDRQPTRCPDSWSPAGTRPPWAAPRATRTRSKWASREARTGTASDAPPGLVCQTSTTWKRRLCDLHHPTALRSTDSSVSPLLLLLVPCVTVHLLNTHTHTHKHRYQTFSFKHCLQIGQKPFYVFIFFKASMFDRLYIITSVILIIICIIK